MVHRKLTADDENIASKRSDTNGMESIWLSPKLPVNRQALAAALGNRYEIVPEERLFPSLDTAVAVVSLFEAALAHGVSEHTTETVLVIVGPPGSTFESGEFPRHAKFVEVATVEQLAAFVSNALPEATIGTSAPTRGAMGMRSVQSAAESVSDNEWTILSEATAEKSTENRRWKKYFSNSRRIAIAAMLAIVLIFGSAAVVHSARNDDPQNAGFNSSLPNGMNGFMTRSNLANCLQLNGVDVTSASTDLSNNELAQALKTCLAQLNGNTRTS